METIARLYLALPREWKRPKLNVGLFRLFGEALDLYRRALSATYVTAMSLDQRSECLPDEDLEGRDPRW